MECPECGGLLTKAVMVWAGYRWERDKTFHANSYEICSCCGYKKRRNGRKRGTKVLLTEEQLYELKYLYLNKDMSLEELSSKFFVARTTLKNYLVDMGVKINPRGTPKGKLRRVDFVRREARAKIINHLYWDLQLPTEEIGRRLGLPETTVLSVMRQFGIERRTIGEAMRLAYKQGRKDVVIKRPKERTAA